MKTLLITFGAILAITAASGPPQIPDKPLPPTTPPKLHAPRSLQNISKRIPPCSTKLDGLTIKNVMTDERYRWTAFNVHPSKDFNEEELNIIQNAMFYLSQAVPCLSFGIWPTDSEPIGDYVRIFKGKGCWSFLGRQGGAQDLSLGCSTDITVVIHEMIHALGLFHEQSRPDRDDYVNIFWNNIIPREQYNFNRCSTSEVTTFGVPYNIESIMHYRSHDFSSNGQPTITTKNGGNVGPSGNIESTDVKKLRIMYKCRGFATKKIIVKS